MSVQVLITRPAEAGARTAVALAAHGWRAVLAPIMAVAATGAPWPLGVVDAVVATSAHAFEQLAGGDLPRLEVRRLMPLFLVGERTAAAATAAGFAGRAWVAPDAERLVDLVAEALPSGRRLLYLAGRDRKPALEAALPRLEQNLEILEVYEAQPVDRLDPGAIAAIAEGRIAAVLHYSHRSAALFCALATAAGADASGPVHVCMSADVAAPLAEAGYPRIETAAAPEEGAIVAVLNTLFPQPGTGAH